jgi:hypothetical protein
MKKMNDQEKLQKAIEVLKKVKTMRDLQKEYFKNRLSGDLQRSKQYERLVDKEIESLLADINKISVAQPDMFAVSARKEKDEDKKVWCVRCMTLVSVDELKIWTGDDALHHLCPGCDSDLLPVEKMPEGEPDLRS